MEDLISTSLNLINVLNATYGDIRLVERKRESISLKNGQVENISTFYDQGFGVRILADGTWGFAASFNLSKKEVERITSLAHNIALASTKVKGRGVKLAPAEKVRDHYKSPFLIDPFRVPLEEKLALLSEPEKILRKGKKIKIAQASADFHQKKQTFASTEGTYITQELTESGAGITALAVENGEVQQRSFPNSYRGNFAAQGYEFVKNMGLAENAERVRGEAEALLSAEECPALVTDIILDSSQLALQIHESVGHPTELDRVLGTETSYAGGSFLSLDQLGKLKYGSEIVNIVADATLKGALGSFGYDDEGIAAQKVDLVRKGLFVGYLSSRETAPLIREKSNGTMRADGWNRMPLIRMTNINLLPGEHRLEDLIGNIKKGIYLDTNKSWSIDDKRINFQFATEIGWEIKKGRKTKILKNCNYTGTTPQFWNSCDGIANKNHWQVWGLPNCGKGEPVQEAHVGHGASPARFRGVQVGVGKRQ